MGEISGGCQAPVNIDIFSCQCQPQYSPARTCTNITSSTINTVNTKQSHQAGHYSTYHLTISHCTNQVVQCSSSKYFHEFICFLRASEKSDRVQIQGGPIPVKLKTTRNKILLSWIKSDLVNTPPLPPAPIKSNLSNDRENLPE